MSWLVVGLRSPRRIPLPVWKDYHSEKYLFSMVLFVDLQYGGGAADRTSQRKAPSTSLVTVKCGKDDL